MFGRVVICMVLISVIYSKPVQEGLKQCYNQDCPEETYACEKISKISEDKKHIISVVRCLGLENNILQNFTESNPNPFGPNAFFQGYSYTGVFSYHNSGNSKTGVSLEPNYRDKEPVDGEVNEKKTEVEVFTE